MSDRCVFLPRLAGLFAGIIGVLAAGSLSTWAQQPKAATKPQARAAGSDPVLATVNGEPIRQSELTKLLGQFEIPAGSEQRAYTQAIDMLVGSKLLAQFLNAQRITVPAKEIDDVVAKYDASAKENKTSLTAELAANNTTMQEFRDLTTRTLQWQKYVLARATDAELKKYAQTNNDAFSGTQVRASHILLRLDPKASEADKQKAREKLEAIKKDIDAGKISFADAANKHSEDPGNQQTPAGGDLNFFPREGQFIESFAGAAFGLKKGEISGPVETEYGLHLIHVTDRREGQPIEFDKVKSEILRHYADHLQEQIVTTQRKEAEAAGKIQIQPMPAGLIKTVVPAPAADAKAAAKPAAPATAKPAAAPKAKGQ